MTPMNSVPSAVLCEWNRAWTCHIQGEWTCSSTSQWDRGQRIRVGGAHFKTVIEEIHNLSTHMLNNGECWLCSTYSVPGTILSSLFLHHPFEGGNVHSLKTRTQRTERRTNLPKVIKVVGYRTSILDSGSQLQSLFESEPTLLLCDYQNENALSTLGVQGRKGQILTCGRFMLTYGRSHHSIVK